jgi:hypothetical protein
VGTNTKTSERFITRTRLSLTALLIRSISFCFSFFKWKLVNKFVISLEHYKFELPEEIPEFIFDVVTLRSICQKCGIKIACRDYNWESETPFTNTDILDLFPKVKHSPLRVRVRNMLFVLLLFHFSLVHFFLLHYCSSQ